MQPKIQEYTFTNKDLLCYFPRHVDVRVKKQTGLGSRLPELRYVTECVEFIFMFIIREEVGDMFR